MKTHETQLDFLRGIAIFGVVCIHSLQSVRGVPDIFASLLAIGQLGVQLFFSISGYIIFKVFCRSERTLLDFLLARFIRIAPAFNIGILLYVIFDFIKMIKGIGPLQTISAPLECIISNSLLLHAFLPTCVNIILGGWSIGTEVTFYLLLPLLCLAMRSLKMGKNFLYALLIIFVFTHIALFYRSGFNADTNQYFFFSIATQGPCFIAGILAALTDHAEPRTKTRLVTVFASASTCILLFLISPFPLYSIVKILVVSIFNYNLLVILKGGVDLSKWGLMSSTGRRSYELYIVHGLIIQFCIYVLNQAGVIGKSHASIVVISVILSTLIISYIIAGFIQRLSRSLVTTLVMQK